MRTVSVTRLSVCDRRRCGALALGLGLERSRHRVSAAIVISQLYGGGGTAARR